MSVSSQTRPAATVDAVTSPHPSGDDKTSPAPVLISEHEVVFGTAAAVSLPRRRVGYRLGQALRSMAASLPSLPPPPPYYPSTRDYLELSRMEREMRRL